MCHPSSEKPDLQRNFQFMIEEPASAVPNRRFSFQRQTIEEMALMYVVSLRMLESNFDLNFRNRSPRHFRYVRFGFACLGFGVWAGRL